MSSVLNRVVLIAFALTICACSGEAGKNAADGVPASTASPASQAAKTAAPPAAQPKTGRDPATLHACEIVTAPEAIKATGGSLLSPSNTPAQLCMWVVEVNGKTESYQLHFQPVELMEGFIAALGQAERGEKVEGPWDEAYIHPQTMGGGFSLIGVRRGDVAFEVKGDRKRPVLEIARLAASRLPK